VKVEPLNAGSASGVISSFGIVVWVVKYTDVGLGDKSKLAANIC
jgi:hypothetical protein